MDEYAEWFFLILFDMCMYRHYAQCYEESEYIYHESEDDGRSHIYLYEEWKRDNKCDRNKRNIPGYLRGYHPILISSSEFFEGSLQE